MGGDVAARLLRDAFEALPEAVAIFDDDGRFVFWNKTFEALYAEGLELRADTRFEDHLRAALATGLVPAAVGREEAWLSERLARFAAAEGAYEHKLSNGHWVRVQDRPLAHGGRIGIRSDITNLAEREQTARLLLEANPAPVIVSDVETLEVLWVNHAAIDFYGYPHDVLLGLKVTDLQVDDELGEARASARRVDSPDFGSEARLHRTASGEHRVVKVTARTLDFSGRAARLVAVIDVTEQHRMREEVRRARNFLKQIIDHVPTAVFAKDMSDDGRFVIYNRASEALFGTSREEAIGRTDMQVFGAEDAARFALQDRVALQLGAVETVEDEVIHRADGSTRSVRTRKVALADGADTGPRYVIGVCEDMTDRKVNEARIAHMAHHDGLTNLPNQYLFDDRLASALARLQDAREMLALLCVDLDGFKAVNDTLGHAAGDSVLQAVADRLRSTLRSCDTAARFGGDEFTILQAPIVEPQEAVRLAERMLATLSAPYTFLGHRLRISASIGVSYAPSHGVESSVLLRRADEALYRAKREGRNTFRLAEPKPEHGAGVPGMGISPPVDLQKLQDVVARMRDERVKAVDADATGRWAPQGPTRASGG